MYSVNCSGDGRQLRRGRDYSLDDAGFEFVLTQELTPRLADLLDIAIAAYIVDRIEVRPGTTEMASGRTWGRCVHVRMGVRDVTFWAKNAEAISVLLGWLTDDNWLFEFDAFTGMPLKTEVAGHLPLPFGDVDGVALFSGGLDSLAGALVALAAGRQPMLLSVETNSRMAATQRSLKRMMRGHWPKCVTASAAVEWHGGDSREPSQRARAFLFLTLAGVVAAGARLRRVDVYENGVGAIALPYLPNQEGAHTTKAMHPATLHRFAALLSAVAEESIEYVNPSLWFTKAQLCRQVPEDQWELIPHSESCDTAYAYRGDGVHRCGACTSCLLRRQALWASGLRRLDRRQAVRTDLVDGALRAEPSASGQLLIMLDQAERIAAALNQSEPWAALTLRFPELVEVVCSRPEKEACLALYASYVDEWRRFPSPLVDRYLDRNPTYDGPAQGGRHA
jgi:7-cyano-7-deazaguanine synthase in queuosine biosynthesis